MPDSIKTQPPQVSKAAWQRILSPRQLVFFIGENSRDTAQILLDPAIDAIYFEPQPDSAAKLRRRNAAYSQEPPPQAGGITSEDIVTLDEAISKFGKPRFCKLNSNGSQLSILRELSQQIDYLSFAHNPRSLEQTRDCLIRLNYLGCHNFNFIASDSQDFIFPEWVSSFHLMNFLRNPANSLRPGDVYAVSQQASQEVKSIIPPIPPGLLWHSKRMPKTGDDLLLSLEERPICRRIKTLYQIGAHRCEEADHFKRLFINLEKLVLFEPNPALFKNLKQRFEKFPYISLLPYAIWHTDGKADFHLANNDGHSSSLLHLGKHQEIFPQVHYDNITEVQTLRLSTAINRHSLPEPDFLFLDAQGAEYKILSAIPDQILKTVLVIYTEASTEEIYSGSNTLDEIRLLLDKSFFFCGYAPQSPGTPTHGNALFINRESLGKILKDIPLSASKAAPLPITVALPTRNSIQFLLAHMEQVRQWSPLVQEFVVIDSQSEDGTLDFIKLCLDHPNIKYFNRPPGLYEAWNDAVNAATGKYIYFATVGDIISSEGIRHLVETSENNQCDVLITPPKFIAEDSFTEVKMKWPIHYMIEDRNIAHPILLPSAYVLCQAILHGIDSILGSSASNLYKTEVLRKFPFPTDFGYNGDSAWGIAHAWRIKLGLSPRECANFLLHSSSDTKTQYFPDLSLKIFRLAKAAAMEAVEMQNKPWSEEEKAGIFNAIALLAEKLLAGQVELADGFYQWAQRSDRALIEQRALSDDYRNWAERTEELLKQARESLQAREAEFSKIQSRKQRWLKSWRK